MTNKKQFTRGLGFIAPDLYIEGTVNSQKKIVVSGNVGGSIVGKQEIVISESGNVNGKVEGSKITIAGKVNGNLLAHNRLDIISSAKIKGEMMAPSGQIQIREGANLEAKCKVLVEDSPKKLSPK